MTISANFPAINPALLLDFASTKALDPRVSFSRPTTATYYDNHTTVVAEQNLLVQSQTLDNASWTKSGSVTVTANSVAAPDGTTTADTLTAGANAAGYLSQDISTTAGSTYTLSLYAQAGNISTLDFGGVNQFVTTYYARFTLTGAGSVSVLSGGATATITQVGSSSWYRCTVTKTVSAGNANDLFIVFPGNNGSITNGNYVYLWGAQLEQRSSVTAYTPTTTTAITNYIPVLLTGQSNEARFDHNPTTRESLGLLIEEQRTNLLTYSEQFNNAAWTGFNTTVSANTNIAPDGTLTADSLVENTNNTYHTIDGTFVSGTGTFTASIYLKTNGRNFVRVFLTQNTPSSDFTALFNLTTGTLVSADAGVTGAIQFVGNGWYRCSVSATTTGALVRLTVGLQNATGAITTYLGNGYSGAFLWGAQLEAGAFATSYIPTVASQVTRSADAASMTGTNFSSWYNNQQGTLYASSFTNRSINGASGNYYASISDGTTSNAIILAQVSALVSQIASKGTTSLNQSLGSNSSFTNVTAKYAVSYSASSTYVALNGVTGSQYTTTVIPTVTSLQIGVRGDSNAITYANACISKLAYYPIACTSAQLQGLTG